MKTGRMTYLSVVGCAWLLACAPDEGDTGDHTASAAPTDARAGETLALEEHCDSGCDRHGETRCAQAQSAPETRAHLLPAGDSPRRGGARARVTIVMASEFECSYCALAASTVQQVLGTYGDRVALVYKHSPLPMHENALSAALAAAAAHRQGKFWEMYDLLFANRDELGASRYSQWAQQLGLDVARFEVDMQSPELRQVIERDMELVRAAGGRGVPNFWVNGRHVVGAQPFDALRPIIEAELAAAE